MIAKTDSFASEGRAPSSPTSTDPIASGRAMGDLPRPLDPNVDEERIALIHAKQFLDLPAHDLQQSIAYLLITNKEQDIEKAAMRARIAGLEA